MTALLHYAEAGKGVPLLLVHGFPHDRRLWQPQLEGLHTSARVIAPDLRGFGTMPKAPATMRMEDHADDLKALLDGKGIERAVICGLSMGGYIALAFAERHPGSLLGLILCHTKSTADTDKARDARYDMIGNVLKEGAGPLAEAMLPKMLSATTRAERPEVSAFICNMMAAQHRGGLVASLRGMAERPDRTPMLAQVAVPTMVIAGAEDTVIPPAESEAMTNALHEAKFTLLPGAAHLGNVDRAEEFNGAVREFLPACEAQKATRSR